ncbi:MAG TPA: RNA methyltransferase [Bacteroidia bacterium]|jgi:tRNA G18 (ribose-2'-O)-methylase SpoU
MRKLKNEELERLTPSEFHKAEKLPVVVVLDNVRSLLNVGSVFRTCDAFRVRELYLCGITGKPPDREIAKTALGATESVSWRYFSRTIEAVEELKKKGVRILAVEQTENALQLDELTMGKDTALAVIFGNEVKGVEQEVIDKCDGAVEIPQAGTKHSLNIAVSAGIVCWQLFSSVKLR